MALNLDDLIGSMQNGFSAGDRGSDLVAMREELRRTLGEHALGPGGSSRAGHAGDGSGGSLDMDYAESSSAIGRNAGGNAQHSHTLTAALDDGDDDVMGMEGVDTPNGGAPEHQQPHSHYQHHHQSSNGSAAGAAHSSASYMYGYGVPGRVGGSYPAYEHGTAGMSSASSPGMRIPSSSTAHRAFGFGHTSSNGSYSRAAAAATAGHPSTSGTGTGRHSMAKMGASPASASTTNYSPHSLAAFSPFPATSLASSVATSTSTSTHHDHGFSPGSNMTSESAMSIASPGPAHAPANTPQQTPVESRGAHMRRPSASAQQDMTWSSAEGRDGSYGRFAAIDDSSPNPYPRSRSASTLQQNGQTHTLDESALHAKLVASAAASANMGAGAQSNTAAPTPPRSPGYQARRSVVGFQPPPSFPA
ncbi:hypothetical protein IE81DRAFT_173441 [Ceraceosorus guamensis]|uniref:Uncharacterized protein n=1 Tax=Ceraceosorus guamensis TaxID=1522189 RepID=A0A316VW04_9BASI|nr:hypothetical protein IE81DRAFT_173441 [Ceraceosorus guamensis]PWN41474.1 hypothetical protein IE81DRAFT_173441 [Ceraceosorus guamensis]